MKKLLSLVAILSFWVSLTMAQTAAPATVKVKKDGTPDKRYTPAKSTTTTKLKKDGTPDKRYTTTTTTKVSPPDKTVQKEKASKVTRVTTTTKPVPAATASSGNVRLKKDGTPDKRYTNSAAPAAAPVQETKTTVTKSTRAPKVTAAPAAKDYKPTVDRSISGPNGEEILTGPRGGKYYINKNGNKTYIKREG